MSEWRDDWKAAKSKVKGVLVLVNETEKKDLGPLLDAVAAAQAKYEKINDKQEPDPAKLKEAKQAVQKALSPALKACVSYTNACRGIMKARPEQAAAAKTLAGALMSITQGLNSLSKQVSR